ncbi:MAG: proteasome alpha subunit [Candidatus Woesearchaeota archaeon]|nr:proteasome alpha subunit [Candidatus Woesearchaeota archaeon]MDN5327660.1 proteasome alpha subunit [Candidatus Woesearchaeota archaeon]
MDLNDHQMMGYDRAITLFSPDGRLLQVEYAKKTVMQGSTALGIVYKDGVALLADKRIMNELIIPESVEKIFVVADHILATGSGIISDARVLISRAQVFAQQHQLYYGNPADVSLVVRDLCDLMQYYTQSGAARPFGVSLLVAGYDFGPQLFETDPTGIYFKYYAKAVGEFSEEADKMLQKEYKEGMSFEQAVSLGLSILQRLLKDKFNLTRIDVGFVDKTKKYTLLTKEQIKSYIKK